ncbi:phosphotransferase-like protein [Nocardia rhamnosiphila]
MRSPELPCRVIFLDGISSSGKTTPARAVQDESDRPFVYCPGPVLRRERTVLG